MNYKCLLTGIILGVILTVCGPVKFFGTIAALAVLTIISTLLKNIKA